MYHKGKDLFSALAMLGLMPLVVTTMRFLLDIRFPYDLLGGSSAYIIAILWFARRSEKVMDPTVALLSVVAGFFMWLEIAKTESILYSGEAWLISVLAWLLLSIWISFGTLIGKKQQTA